MASAYSKIQIIQDALALAGRSSELTQACRQWLNYGLRDLGLTFRFPELRKIGAQQTLAAGSATASLPADFGAGMDKFGMIFGPDNKPLTEVSFEEFATTQGFPIPNSTGRPLFFLIDKNAGQFRFNMIADQNYNFTPVYFITPPLPTITSSDDTSSVWLDNDQIAVHMLIWWIFVFNKDEREAAQEARLNRMIVKWQRETVRIGGTSRALPSPARFKNTGFTGMGGFTGF